MVIQRTNWYQKIDSRLWDLYHQPGHLKDEVDLIVMINPGYPLELPGIEDIKITQRFNYIAGMQVLTTINKLPSIAQLDAVKSIWWNLPIQSQETANIDVNQLTRTIELNADPTFANFTKEVGASDMWVRGFNGSDVVIAVLDAGVDITGSGGGDLDDFDGNTTTPDTKYLGAVSMVPEEPLYYTDLNGRGTFHTGIACGTGDLNSSYIGVAPGASYLNVKVYDSIGITFWTFIISGIEWAVSHGADIILFCTTIPGLYLDPVCTAINQAVDQGVLVIAPVGDDGPGYMSVNTPGQAAKALTVGAYNSFTGEVWNQSSRGPNFDFSVGPSVIAPGVGLIGPRSRIFSESSMDMLTGFSDMAAQYGINLNLNMNIDFSAFSATIPKTSYGEPLSAESNYTRASGTGAAAAVVAGAAAILMSAFPMASPQFIHQALVKTATPITQIAGRTGNDMNSEGAGLINVSAAFDYLNQFFPINQYKIIPLSVPLLYPGVITSTDIQNITSTDFAQFSNNTLDSYDITALFSTQAMMTALVISNSTDQSAMNMTSIHLPLNQFGLEYSLSTNPNKREFYWFSQFKVVREMHQMINSQTYQEGYNRYAGVLELDGLYTVVLAESWSYTGNYLNTTVNISVPNPWYNMTVPTDLRVLNITNRVNAFKYSFIFINDRPGVTYQDLKLFSYFKADLFLNETGLTFDSPNQTDLLGFSYDDIVRFDPDTQTLWVEDENNDTSYVSSDRWAAMGFRAENTPIYRYAIGDSISMLLNITLNRLNASCWNSTTDEFVMNNQAPNVDPGFASVWNLSDIPYNQSTSFTGVLSMGLGDSVESARSKMFNNTHLILTNVTKYNITDLMVLSADFNRMAEKDVPYLSKAKIINIGNNPVETADLAFAINRSNTDDTLEVYSRVNHVRNLQPFEIRTFEATWVPLETGVYTAGWVFGTVDYIALQTEANLLSNSLAITVFVIDGQYYDQLKYDQFLVFPMHLDQNPMRIFAPIDFGIYNLTVLSIRKIQNVEVKADGLGRNMTLILQSSYDEMNPYQSIFLILIGNPVCPPGKINFNITFTQQGNETPFYRIPVEIQLVPNRGRIWFDATHLNVFVSDNFFGTSGLSILDGFTDNQSTNPDLSGIDLGGFTGGIGDFGNVEMPAGADFDLTRFLDLNERLDTTWGNFYNLRQLWSEPNSNNGKGASLFTIIPLLELNLTEVLGMDITQFRTTDLIPPTSFLGQTLGDYYFENEVLSTNWINHDVLQFFDALVINDPEQAFLPKEIENITSWVEQGGTLYVFAEDMWHNNIPSLNKLLQPYELSLSNESFYPYSDLGYYNYDLTPFDYDEDLFYNTSISRIAMKDPIKITKTSNSSDSILLCNDTVAYVTYGQGKVIVIGDNDIMKNLLLDEADNMEFARQILRVGLGTYFHTDISAEPAIFPLYGQGFVDINITNFDEVQSKNLTSRGFLFVSVFFYENGTLINASMYGMQIPGLPMFFTDNSHYATYLDSSWFPVLGDFYVLILIDHPAAASELFYIKFTVIDGPPPVPYQKYQAPPQEYPHYIDIIGILAIVYMGLNLWYYDMEKYKTRLRITQLQGDYLNVARTRLNEGKTLLKLLLQGMKEGDMEEIERIRLLLSNRKRMTQYFKDLKDFGESIGEHY
jgi:subtilisin family serine protease